MNMRILAIRQYAQDHSVHDTAKLIIRLLGLDTPKDDSGHWYKEEGAPCPHNKHKEATIRSEKKSSKNQSNETKTNSLRNKKNDYTGKSLLFKIGETQGKNDFSGGAFTKASRKMHVRHLSEFGNISPTEYENRARKLASKSVGGNIAGGRDRNGQILRYDKEKCELVLANPKTKAIVTYFIVKNGNREAAEKYMKRHFPDIVL